MEQGNGKRAVPDRSEGEGAGQGSEVPAYEVAGVEQPPHEDASPEQEEDAAPAVVVEENGGEEVFEAQEDLAAESEGDAAVVGNVDHGAASESDKNKDPEVPKNPLAERFRFLGPIAHPTPPTTYRRLPLRSRKQYHPTRFCADADQRAMNEAQGSTSTVICSELDDATVDKPRSDECNGDGADATASSSLPASYRPPSRSRKQRRPDRFIPEQDEASARAKARRSNAVLDRFITFLLRVSPERRPEWTRNVTADVDRGQGHGDADGDGSRTASEEAPEQRTGGRPTILAVLAVLAVALALSIVSCVLFYIICQRTVDHGHQK